MTPKSLLAPARLAGRPVLRSQSDERLVDLVRAGSEPAFEAIVSRYRGPLLRYCNGILPEGRAEDAVQQSFVSAFAAMNRDDAHLDLRPWLYRIAHNTALNGLRDRGFGHVELDEGIDGVERPDQMVERRQSLREVLAALMNLPERQRDAMVLRELEGRSYEEIAGALGVTGGAVRQLLNRARNTLRAGVTAITPLPVMVWLWSGEGEPTAARVGELVGAGGAGALATKVAATAIVTGAVAGGIATVPDRHGDSVKLSQPPAATAASESGESEASGSTSSQAGSRQGSGSVGTAGDSSGRDGSDDGGRGGDDHSGSGSGESGGDDGGGHSGPGGGGGDGGHSGSGGSSSSGPGSGDSGTSHEGPGGGGSGSGSGEVEVEAGTDSSGSSGSGSSGSGSSGSGSSGPGSGTTTTTDSSGPG
jgi:RNA polymerase sigma factor (sigma-70 family)